MLILAYDGYLVEGKPLLNGGLITDIDKYSEIDIKTSLKMLQVAGMMVIQFTL